MKIAKNREALQKEHKIVVEQRQEVTEEQWRQMALKRWVWLREEYEVNPTASPKQLLAAGHNLAINPDEASLSRS